MKKITIFVLVISCSFPTYAQDDFHVYNFPGYDNLVPIPGSDFTVHQKDRPQPIRVTSAKLHNCEMLNAPSDATILFDGKSLQNFEETTWRICNGHLIAAEGNLVTKTNYGDCQLHIEWRTPNPPIGDPGNMGNSGIYFMELYELQIFDSYSCEIYADGSAAAIYGQTPPMVNVCRAPGQWQTFDVFFTSPKFDQDSIIESARISVLHNGVVVHNNTKILGPTVHKDSIPYKVHADKAPILIQGHNSPVEFRNIWVRNL